MPRTTPEQAAAKWSQRLSGSTQQITDGVNSVTVAPTAQAAKAQAKMLANLTASVQNGKWAASLNKVTLSDWQQAMLTKGVPRIASGAQAAQPKMGQFFTKLFPFQATLQQQISSMPSMTLEENIARMNAFTRGMAKFNK